MTGALTNRPHPNAPPRPRPSVRHSFTASHSPSVACPGYTKTHLTGPTKRIFIEAPTYSSV